MKDILEILSYFKDKKINNLLVKKRAEYVENVCVYNFLCKEYAKGNVKGNLLFQFVYSSFYGLNRALKPKMKTKYFELMEKEGNIEFIMGQLCNITSKRHFSFATKLIHTRDNYKPIWDQYVGKVIGIGRPKEDYLKKYGQLEELYVKLLESSSCKKQIDKFQKEFGIKKGTVSDQKILDFILWGLGKEIMQ